MLRHTSRLLVAAAALAVPAASISTAAAASGIRPQAGAPRLTTAVRANVPAPAGVRGRPVGTVPFRVANPSAYAAQKAAANAAAARLNPRASASAARAPLAPSLVRNWAGQQDTNVAPSDSTGAIGTTRYIELVNSKAAIYSRTSNTPTASGPLLKLTGCATSACTDQVFDVQVIWDPALNRFFYTTMDLNSGSTGGNLLDFGFSTTGTPTLSASSWCRYSIGFGSTIPDYPKLGDTTNFLLIGTNDFSGSGAFQGSTIFWITHPPSGSSCPKASTFKAGITKPLKNSNGSAAFTPVPGSQTDRSSTGWAVARPLSIPSAGATFLTVFKVTKSSTDTAVIPVKGTTVPVAAYNVPASAPQPGTPFKLDTLAAQPTQAVTAVDPKHGSVMALWTQHTVFGGAGAQVRWYEINPAKHSLIQHGTISDASLFTFNGAISPDRRVNGSSAKFGGDMVISVNQSSASALPALRVASKIASNAISALQLVATSSAADMGFDCRTTMAPNLCRWGDYSGASPDPASPTTRTTGEVWGSSMLAASGGSASSAGWTTRNFAVRP
jgi:hypothetical protein